MTYKPNLKKRILSTIIDYGIYLIFFYFYVRTFGEQQFDGSYSANGLTALPVFIFWFVYFVIIEADMGCTLGHKALGLKVISLDGKKIGFSHAFKRHILDTIDILFYGIPAIIAIKNSDKHQRLGDMFAKTIVIDLKDEEQA